jgi:hypothetical protein
MKSFVSIAFLAAALVSSFAHAQDAASVAQATEAAGRWLAAADAGKADVAWDQSASAFQAAVPRAALNDIVKGARAPFGEVQARELTSTDYTRSMPGVPEGEYVVIQYTTRFNKGNATETVVPMRDRDGSWKVSGYFIK